jgi:hypothetical protein
MEARQSAYDSLTQHGVDKQAQLEWNRQIAKEIDELME